MKAMLLAALDASSAVVVTCKYVLQISDMKTEEGVKTIGMSRIIRITMQLETSMLQAFYATLVLRCFYVNPIRSRGWYPERYHELLRSLARWIRAIPTDSCSTPILFNIRAHPRAFRNNP